MIQDFINKQFYNIYIFSLLFCIILYNPIGFKSADEIGGLFLLLLFLFSVFKTEDWAFNKAFLVTLGIFFFYTCYSIAIVSNSKKAIFTDLIIQLKPYLAFFAVYQLKPHFDKIQKDLLQKICIIIWFILLPVGIIGFFNENFIFLIMKHPTDYVAVVVGLALTYLFCSNYTTKDKAIFLLMLVIGLSTGRSKFYGFFILSVVSILYFGKVSNIKLNLKNIVILLITLIIIGYFTWEKIHLYFVAGITGEVEKNTLARFVLYTKSLDIFKDFFPFGSGLASFATHASGAYYSHIYSEYGVDSVWGMSKNNWSFIADTYYPSLAQFGLVGVTLYITFWIYILKKAYISFLQSNNAKYIIISILIIAYIAIENVADASITSNRGFFMMMLLGLTLAEMKQKEKNSNIEIDSKNGEVF